MGRFVRCARHIQPLFRRLPDQTPAFLCGRNLFVSYLGWGNERTSKRNFSQIRSDNPYEVLGISNSATYAEAKQRFLELALKHHPDHASTDDSSEEASPDDFIRFRKAFESLKKTMDGNITHLKEGESSWTDEEFIAWYYEETSQSNDLMFKIDMKTRREVIDVVKQSQAQGGLDRGGVWEMARRMAEEEAILLENKNKIKRSVGLDAGAKSDTNSSLGRRRRKKR
mmetsp:Transcript_8922/g.18535  ORF Transcript_8922/g.18535 Transcript_8922/m.18535 type:complete len:226 (+) Transcript_8922:62-739(+)